MRLILCSPQDHLPNPNLKMAALSMVKLKSLDNREVWMCDACRETAGSDAIALDGQVVAPKRLDANPNPPVSDFASLVSRDIYFSIFYKLKCCAVNSVILPSHILMCANDPFASALSVDRSSLFKRLLHLQMTLTNTSIVNGYMWSWLVQNSVRWVRSEFWLLKLGSFWLSLHTASNPRFVIDMPKHFGFIRAVRVWQGFRGCVKYVAQTSEILGLPKKAVYASKLQRTTWEITCNISNTLDLNADVLSRVIDGVLAGSRAKANNVGTTTSRMNSSKYLE